MKLERDILESLAEGVVAVDEAGLIVSANGAARTLLGLGPLPLGVSFFETVRQRELQELTRTVLATGLTVNTEYTVFAPVWRVLRAQAVAGAGDSRAVLLIQDVTERFRYEQLRREFVAHVSHELKSPLTSIRSLTETLLDGGGLEDPSCNRRFLGLIDEDSKRLSRLIDDLLILSEIESRALPLQVARLSLAPLVQALLAPLEVLVEQKGLQVECLIAGDLEVWADPDRLRQVVGNLVDNAVKYCHRGGRVEVRAERDGPSVEVVVDDTGPGIPAEACERVFERFYRVDKNRSRELGGTGLGLSIVKHIVESHGGTVWVKSVVGKGTAFHFTLPDQTGSAAPQLLQPVPAAPEPAPAESLEEQLSLLQARLVALAGRVEGAVGQSIRALLIRDAELAREVLAENESLDREEGVIDDLCVRLLEEHQPRGVELRVITGTLKLIVDLERMGHLAVGIARRTLELLKMPLLRPLVQVSYMAERVQLMVRDCLDALVRRDAELARAVTRRDQEIDALNMRVLSSLTHDASTVDVMLIARSLERIADHATNLAEDVIYIVTGRR